MSRKFLFLGCVLSAIIVFALASTDCNCWEEFKPEKGENGQYYCRGEKNHRIFKCNEEKPPICKCLVNQQLISLDLGETSCLSVDLQNGRWCQNKSEWLEYFKKHPEHAIYD